MEWAQAQTALDDAIRAIEVLSIESIREIKSFKSPPLIIEKTFEVLMRMIGCKTDWASAKVAMANPKKFLEELKSFDKDNAVHLMTCLRNYCEDERFSYDNVARVNKGTASLT
jgi:hypothetical protein